MNTKKIAVLLIASMLLAVVVSAGIAQGKECEACSARPLPKGTTITDGASAYTNAAGEYSALQSASSAPGYCPSYGGSHSYEYISSVTYTQNPGGTMTITVDIYTLQIQLAAPMEIRALNTTTVQSMSMSG